MKIYIYHSQKTNYVGNSYFFFPSEIFLSSINNPVYCLYNSSSAPVRQEHSEDEHNLPVQFSFNCKFFYKQETSVYR